MTLRGMLLGGAFAAALAIAGSSLAKADDKPAAGSTAPSIALEASGKSYPIKTVLASFMPQHKVGVVFFLGDDVKPDDVRDYVKQKKGTFVKVMIKAKDASFVGKYDEVAWDYCYEGKKNQTALNGGTRTLEITKIDGDRFEGTCHLEMGDKKLEAKFSGKTFEINKD